MPASREFGFGFLTTQRWNPVTEKFGAIAPIYGTIVTSLIAMVIGVPVSFGIAIFLTELCPYPLRRPIGIAIELLAGIPSIIYGIWGLFVFAPFLQATVQPFLIDTFGNVPVLDALFAGPPYGIGIFTAGLILAIMVLPFITAITRDVFLTVPPVLKEAAYGVGCTTWEVVRKVVLPYTRVGVIGGVMLGLGRALGETMAVTFVIGNAHRISASHPGAGHHHLRLHRQRVQRGGRRPLHLVADRARPHPLRHHLHRPGRRPAHADADREEPRLMKSDGPLRPPPAAQRHHHGPVGRRDRCSARPGWSSSWRRCCGTASAGLSLEVFTANTPPPGSAGGLANAIVGSLILTVMGVVIGTPIGILAGTYMAEYGRYSRLTTIVRFVNDILLSAPSIVIGLFVYEIMVARMGHFSGWAGGVALAILVLPVVIRTTEDMLLLVPDSLREAASGLGSPRWKLIADVSYRAARAGIVTGVLLAIARITGETAPLLFTVAQQPVLEPRPERADGQPAGHHLPVRAVAL